MVEPVLIEGQLFVKGSDYANKPAQYNTESDRISIVALKKKIQNQIRSNQIRINIMTSVGHAYI